MRLRAFLAAYYGLAVAWGWQLAHWKDPSPVGAFVSLGMPVALGWWAIADARGRGRPLPLLSRPWFILGGVVLVPGYVVFSRGWRGLLWVLFHAAMWCLVANATMHLFGVMLYGDEWQPADGL